MNTPGATVTVYHRRVLLNQFSIYLSEFKDIPSYKSITKYKESDFIPRLYTNDELDKILDYTYKTKVIRKDGKDLSKAIFLMTLLLISTGMRTGEVLNLKVEDLNLIDGIIKIYDGKNHKDRIIPISDSVKKNCSNYISSYSGDPTNYLLTFEKIKFYYSFYYARFKETLIACGIKKETTNRGFRIHDFRHTFAVNTLTSIVNSQEDVNANISYLSTYLGHKGVKETQKYIWMTPELYKSTMFKMEDYVDFIDEFISDGSYE
jgi:integrase